MLKRINFYDGGVVTLAKNLSDQGKTINEILKAIQIAFPNLPGGKKGKPTEPTGLQNILKKELSQKIYKQRHGPKRFTQETIDEYLKLRDTMTKAQIQEELDISPAKQGKIDKDYGLGRRKTIVIDRKFSPEDIEKFKKLRKTMSAPEIREELGISEPYQTQLARKLKLPPKVGGATLSKKFSEADSVGTAIKNRIDTTKSIKENFDVIYPDVKNEKFRTGTTRFGKPSAQAVLKAITRTIMSANQLSVDEYKDEIRKMVADRNYAPKGLDPLGIKTDKLKNYAIPNYKQAKAELAKEIPSLDKRIITNIYRRKKLKRNLKEVVDPTLRLSRLSQRARRGQIKRIDKLGLSTTLNPREEAINQTQTSIQKSSNDRIKSNPEAMKRFLKNNPEKLKALGTRVNRQTGQIYYEKPNLDLLNTNPKDTQRFFELDHGREISKQAGKLIDTPENRNTIPRLLNQGFKRDAEIYIESNPNPKDPKVQAVLEEAKKLKVRIRPKVPTGTFKADNFFRPVANPLLKIQDSITFYAPPEFQTNEILLPKDKTGKAIYKLSSTVNTAIKTTLINKATNNDNNICEVVFGAKGLASGGPAGGGCAKQMELEFDKAPEQTLNKIAQSSNSTLKGFAQRSLNLFPKLGTVGKLAAGTAGVGLALSGLRYNSEKGEIVTTNTDQKADQNQILQYVKDNPIKVAAGTSLGFAAEEIPGAYRTARGVGERGPLPKGRGKVRSALGISGALRPVLTTFGTPLVTGLFEGAVAGKRLDEGETMTEVLTDPLGPALGVSLMEPLSKLSGVVRDAPKRTMLEGAKNYFNLSNVGAARPGITGQILRMGMSPKMIAGASRFLGLPGVVLGAGLAGYDAYKNYQNKEGMIYNLFNKDE